MLELIVLFGFVNAKPVYKPISVPIQHIQTFYNVDKDLHGINCLVALKEQYLGVNHFETKELCDTIREKFRKEL